MTQPSIQHSSLPTLDTHRCVQPGCQFGENNECMEGISPVECKNLTPLERAILTPDPSETDVQPAVALTSPQGPQSTEVGQRPSTAIYSGRTMSRDEAHQFLQAQETTLIVITGPVDSGKTTLISRAFVQFMSGPTAHWRFAGSRTLLSFDERIYRHRQNSGQEKAHTLHTPAGQEDYFHLELQAIGGQERRTLLLHDLSGETYQQAIDSSEAAAELKFIERADVLCFLLNGARLSNQLQAYALLHKLGMIARSIFEEHKLHDHTKVRLLITMWDRVTKQGREQTIEPWITKAEDRLCEIMTEVGLTQTISTHRVASISHTKKLRGGHGFDAVFQEWATARDRRQLIDEVAASSTPEGWGSVGAPRISTKQEGENT